MFSAALRNAVLLACNSCPFFSVLYRFCSRALRLAPAFRYPALDRSASDSFSNGLESSGFSRPMLTQSPCR